MGSLRDREVGALSQTARARISKPVSEGQCHLIHLNILRRFSWPSLAYMWKTEPFGNEIWAINLASGWSGSILLDIAFGTIIAKSQQKEARSRDYALLFSVLYGAQYHRYHRTLQTFDETGTLYMHDHNDKYPTRPGFEPSTSDFRATTRPNKQFVKSINFQNPCGKHVPCNVSSWSLLNNII